MYINEVSHHCVSRRELAATSPTYLRCV